MSQDNEGLDFKSGYSESDDAGEFDDSQFDDLDDDENDDDFLVTDDDDSDDEDEHPDNDSDDNSNYESRYKDLQSEFTKTKEELISQRDSLSGIEHKLTAFGGIDKALAALEYVTTDPDFKSLAERKQKGEVIDGIDESKMSPAEKNAFDTVKKMVGSLLSPFQQEMNQKLDNVVKTKIDPQTRAMNDVSMEQHIDKMTEKYGDKWLEQLDSMEKHKDLLSETAQVAPSFKDVERLFIESMREDGKLDKFAMDRAKFLSQKAKKKSVNRSKSNSSLSKSNQLKPAKSIMEAGKRALAKMEDR